MNKEYLYSPWRMEYIQAHKQKECIFCFKPETSDDEKNLIVYRSKHCYVILNLYPYNNGHLMVVPYKHVPRISSLSKTILNDVFSTVQLTERILYSVYKCEGINIGINQGKAAGAGIDEHLHVHLVPRWVGDANFMSTLNGTRVIPEAFDVAFDKLAKAFGNSAINAKHD